MRVNAGKLNHRIRIVRPVRTQDADGYWTQTDDPVYSCWAQFSRTSGTELAKNNADYGQVTCRFLIRATSKRIDRKMVVVYDDQRWEIQYVNEYGDSREYTELICRQLTMEATM